MRIAIVGGPNTGKTTMALDIQAQYDGVVTLFHTDVAKGLPWSKASEYVAEWFDAPGNIIVEGCTVPRALRKWLRNNPGQPAPLDAIIVLRHERAPTTDAQARMAKGVYTVWDEVDKLLDEHEQYTIEVYDDLGLFPNRLGFDEDILTRYD